MLSYACVFAVHEGAKEGRLSPLLSVERSFFGALADVFWRPEHFRLCLCPGGSDKAMFVVRFG